MFPQYSTTSSGGVVTSQDSLFHSLGASIVAPSPITTLNNGTAYIGVSTDWTSNCECYAFTGLFMWMNNGTSVYQGFYMSSVGSMFVNDDVVGISPGDSIQVGLSFEENFVQYTISDSTTGAIASYNNPTTCTPCGMSAEFLMYIPDSTDPVSSLTMTDLKIDGSAPPENQMNSLLLYQGDETLTSVVTTSSSVTITQLD